MIERTIPEWGHLRLKDDFEGDEKAISKDIAENLFETSAKLRINKTGTSAPLTLTKYKIIAKNFVGIIQTRNCRLEILPKLDTPSKTEDDEKQEIRSKLLDMIAVSHNLNIGVGSRTSLKDQKNSILEILISVYAKKLTEVVRKGLPQKYVQHEEDLPTLKGSLIVTRQFTIHAANPSRLACRFDQFSVDIPLNQVMKATVDFLANFSRSVENQKLLRDLSLVFADVSKVPVDQLSWNTITINRSNNQWRELFSMSELFLRRQFQTTTSGRNTGFSLLFDMNRLFEEYIGRMVRRAVKKIRLESGCNWETNLQRGNKYCIEDEISGKKEFRTQPDIIIKLNSKVVHVIDTKWKHVSKKESSIWKDVSQGDVYQMMAYGDLFSSSRISLFYPHSKKLGQPVGSQRVGEIQNHKGRYLEIFTFDLTEKNDLQLDRLQRFLTDWNKGDGIDKIKSVNVGQEPSH